MMDKFGSKKARSRDSLKLLNLRKILEDLPIKKLYDLNSTVEEIIKNSDLVINKEKFEKEGFKIVKNDIQHLKTLTEVPIQLILQRITSTEQHLGMKKPTIEAEVVRMAKEAIAKKE